MVEPIWLERLYVLFFDAHAAISVNRQTTEQRLIALSVISVSF